MTVKNIIEVICIQRGVSKSELAQDMGLKRRSDLLTPIYKDEGMGVKVRTLIDWMEKLGYQLVITPVDDGEEMILDGENEL